jgi:hypothetical protein
MAEPTFSEASTYPAADWLDDFFSDKPTDLRFVKVQYKKIQSTTPSDKVASQYIFNLLERKPPYCWLLSDTYLRVGITIQKKSGGLPDTTLPEPKPAPDVPLNAPTYVGPVNCAVSSLFENLQTFINNVPIETTPNYHYKCYFNDTLTFDDLTKETILATTGYAADTPVTDNTPENTGFTTRCSWFKDNFETSTAYRAGGCTFMAPFKHILWGIEKPIPPFFPITFVLTRSPNEFYLMKLDQDKTEYVVNINNIDLFVKEVSIEAELYKQLSHRLTKEPIKYFLRKQEVKRLQIPPENQEWTTERLFPDNTIPIKVYLAIVPTKAFCGSQTSNPYEFKRRWQVQTVGCNQMTSTDTDSDFYKQKLEEQQRQHYEELEKQRKLQEVFQADMAKKFQDLMTLLSGTKSTENIGATQTTENIPTKSSMPPSSKSSANATKKGKGKKTLKTPIKSKPVTRKPKKKKANELNEEIEDFEEFITEDDEYVPHKSDEDETDESDSASTTSEDEYQTCETEATEDRKCKKTSQKKREKPKPIQRFLVGDLVKVFVVEMKLGIMSDPFDEVCILGKTYTTDIL